MKSSRTRTHAAPAAPVTEADYLALSDEEWEKVDARLYAEYRAKYKKECADYRKKFGEEPSLGTLMAAEARRECNDLTEEEEEELFAHGMSIIYGTARKPKPLAHA